MNYKQRKKAGSNKEKPPKQVHKDMVSVVDTKTGGPMGVLDGEDLKRHGKQKQNEG